MLRGMRATIDRCPEGRFELARAFPASDLADAVVRYAGYREGAVWSLRQREVATTIVPLIINLGPAFRVRLGDADALHGSFVAGLYDGYADVAALGPAHCLQVDLTPLGARRFFGLPMRELAGRTVALERVAGRAVDALADQLYHAAGWEARFRLLDDVVRRRLAAAPAPAPAIAWAWQKLVASGGRVRIDALARELGWSRKHQAQRFALEIGAPPKTVARILRFAHARRAILTGPAARDWAGRALDWGYADQAHLIREFRALAGTTPARYAAGADGPEVTNHQDGATPAR
jgi:AraC-like DNA-binding protein